MKTASDPYDLQRFVDAQRGVYARAEAELRAGRKEIQVIFGHPDYLKFHSSMTLFARAAEDNQIFLEALRKYHRFEFDRQTIELL
jgi:uncharacterized protein (DUF1810 family)